MMNPEHTFVFEKHPQAPSWGLSTALCLDRSAPRNERQTALPFVWFLRSRKLPLRAKRAGNKGELKLPLEQFYVSEKIKVWSG